MRNKQKRQLKEKCPTCKSLQHFACRPRQAAFCKGGVQWKQGVVIRMFLYTILLYIYIYIYITTPIHCTPLRLHPPVMNTHTSCAPKWDLGNQVLNLARKRIISLHMFAYIHTYIQHVCVYIYIYICMSLSLYIYIYIYT